VFKLASIFLKLACIAMLFCLQVTFSFGQNKVLKDSPAIISNTTQEVDSLNERAFRKKRTDVFTAFSQLNEAQNIAKQLNYTKGIAVALLYEAGIYQQSGYRNKALLVYYKALEISKQLNDSFNIARCNLQIAGALTDNKKFNDAAILYQQSLQTFQQLKNKRQVVNVINGIGHLHLHTKNYDSAIAEFNQALAMSKEVGYIYGEKKANQNLGLLYLTKDELVEAETYFIKAKLMDEKANDFYGLSFSNAKLSTIAYKKKQFEKSIQYALDGYSFSKKAKANSLAEENITCIISAYKLRNNISEINRWQDSLIAHLKDDNRLDKEYAINFIDLIRQEESQTLLAEQKASQVATQSKIRLIIIFFGTLILVGSIIFSIFTLRSFRKQKGLGKQLAEKNSIIEENILALDQYNKAISEQNERLGEENKMKDKLLSIISHDLRHPMINTKGIIDLINNGLLTPDESKELFVDLDAQYVRSIALLDNLLYWLRGQMQGKTADIRTVDFGELISKIINEQELSFKKKNIQIQNSVGLQINVNVDSEMMKVVIRNLITNAIKFTPEFGTVSTNYSFKNNTHYFSFQDSGVGIGKEEIEKINQKNYYSTIGTSQEKGTGFGIMLCKDLLAKHNGQLIIESELNKGSTFTIILPAN
jgi:signal transduction histidine kinase